MRCAAGRPAACFIVVWTLRALDECRARWEGQQCVAGRAVTLHLWRHVHALTGHATAHAWPIVAGLRSVHLMHRDGRRAPKDGRDK